MNSTIYIQFTVAYCKQARQSTLKSESFDLPDGIIGGEVDQSVDDRLIPDAEVGACDTRLHPHRHVVALETLEEWRKELGCHDSCNGGTRTR